MILRKGFVSNSSSSSFVCDVCNEIFEDYDATFKDLGATSCTYGHNLCEDHVLEPTKEILMGIINRNQRDGSKLIDDDDEIHQRLEVAKDFEIDEIFQELFDMNNVRSRLPSCMCPICQFKDIKEDIFYKYLLKKLGLDYEEIRKEVKEKFKNYRQFISYVMKR